MKVVTLPVLLFLASLWLVACTPGATDAPEAISTESGLVSDGPATTATLPGESPTQPAVAEVTATEAITAAIDATATNPPAATEVPPGEPLPSPTTTAAATVESAADVMVNGRTPEGAYFLGRADAPVTIIDYSDFM